MERLTSREPRVSGMPGMCCTHFGGGDCRTVHGACSAGCLWEEAAWERLAAYEDIGLEPDEVMQTKLALEGKLLAEIKEFDGIPADRVIELLQAEKDGRLVVLPDAKYTEADGEKALQKAMFTCGNTNNPVTRYTADAIVEKLCREAKEENPPLTLEELREMDGEPVWNDTMKKYALVDAGWWDGIGRTVDSRGKWRELDDRYYRRKPEEGIT